ncbi:MAG: hypothetical protein AAGU75_02695 [Bacillota bacterium]
MKKISTFMLLVSILWYAAATSGNFTAFIAAIIVTLAAFPIWAFVVAGKIGRNPWKWALLCILLPLIGPLVLAVTAREDITAAQRKEIEEGKKGFWESRFSKFGELIPYVLVFLIVLVLAGLPKLGWEGKQKFINTSNVSTPVEYFPSSLSTPDPGAFERDKSNIPFSGEQAWPDYLPKDIPPIPADIDLVWADSITARIFFRNLAPDDFSDYLREMENNGFSLEYVIYTQPGVTLSEDDLKRLSREGKFDAVRIKKDKYNFYIEYGANEGTYDLNVKDFLDPGEINP